MSRDAVKFGRMSKKQRDSLYAEVQKHQQNQEQVLGREGADAVSRGYSTSGSSGFSDLDDLSALSDGILLDFPLTPEGSSSYYSLELPLSTQHSPDPCHVATPDPLPGLGEEKRLLDIIPTDIEQVTQNIIRSHLDTCQFTSDELRRMTWNIHSQEEVRILQSKSCEEMWQICAIHLSNAVQYVVEFAKRLDGFMELCQNDQIVLLKAGCLEVLLIRMTRVFNPLHNTVFFEGKFGGIQMFRSLGCDDLVSAIFDLGRTLCCLELSDEEIALFSAAVLMSPDRPWLTESNKVQKLQDRIFMALQREIQKRHCSDDLLAKMISKLPLMKTICNLHSDKLEFFRLLHPDTAHTFPPLYKEVFSSELQYTNLRES
ncbi:nuclear receptor ROR-beta-like [Spea bombifrons]|uniref:nuclear receptor ROR-beta-like n=1 Tax=Spea bombifrons TaxID=233779 RepID=UPI00234ADA91|nr:nuclear receptor ROR-beta-like [Spea bombifrons]